MKKKSLALLIALSPSLAYAQAFTSFKTFAEFVLRIFSGLTSILFALAGLGLLYGVVLYFANGDNPEKREQIKPYLFWTVVGIAVMFTIYALVGILVATFFGGGGFGIPFLSSPA